jgi:hypothetical protein
LRIVSQSDDILVHEHGEFRLPRHVRIIDQNAFRVAEQGRLTLFPPYSELTLPGNTWRWVEIPPNQIAGESEVFFLYIGSSLAR